MDPSEIYQMLATRNISYDLSTSPHEEANAAPSDQMNGGRQNQKFYIMRHGERVDFTFGTWIPYCFDDYGNYIQKDLNMPKKLICRKNNIVGWDKDSPLTNVGVFQAKLLGQSLKENGVKIDIAFSSPSYRCVQTCNSVLEQMNLKDSIKINLEPGLFEWLAWYAHNLEGAFDWCSISELQAANYNIKVDYDQIFNRQKIVESVQETLNEYYDRNHMVMTKIMEQADGGNVLIVGHASTLDACTRKFCGHETRISTELTRLMQKVPYCSCIVMEEKHQGKDAKWEVTDGPLSTVTHSSNPRFDWRVLK